jgi:hypothetical protein
MSKNGFLSFLTCPQLLPCREPALKARCRALPLNLEKPDPVAAKLRRRQSLIHPDRPNWPLQFYSLPNVVAARFWIVHVQDRPAECGCCRRTTPLPHRPWHPLLGGGPVQTHPHPNVDAAHFWVVHAHDHPAECGCYRRTTPFRTALGTCFWVAGRSICTTNWTWSLSIFACSMRRIDLSNAAVVVG